MNVLKICTIDWKNASRDKRELAVYRDQGAKVAVMAKATGGSRFYKETVDGFDVFRFTTRPWGERIPTAVNRLVSLVTWSRSARRLQPDVISGHGLIALFIGWLSNWGRRRKAKLIYDSHEFELGLSRRRGRLHWWALKHFERFLMERCALSIMVNDGIADKVQHIHGLQTRPIVVRNIPDKWELQEEVTQAVRRKFCDALHCPDDTFLVMYHGAIMPGRGIETILEVIGKKPEICGIILGYGEPDYVRTVQSLAVDLDLESRVLFHSAVPLKQLKHYVSAADASLITLDVNIKNYLFSLPNKFFESIQSLTPLIIYDLPEMKRIVEQYDIGLVCKENSVAGICACIDTLRNDRERYRQLKRNLAVAKEVLCWENEKKVLEDAWLKFISKIEGEDN